MAVGRSEITDVHTFKDVLLTSDDALERVVEANDALLSVLIHPPPRDHLARSTVTPAVVGRTGLQSVEQILHSSDTAVDRHIIIIQDNQYIIGRVGSIVQSFVSQATAHGAIPDDGHDTSAFTLGLGSQSDT